MAEANYSNNDYYHYSYDAVGNRETQTTLIGGLPSTTSYVYDDANRLTSMNGVNYLWDDNGNLLNDGVKTCTYKTSEFLENLEVLVYTCQHENRLPHTSSHLHAVGLAV